MEWMPQAIRDGVIVVLVISGPLVLAAAFIGLVIGVLQAATQVQEQTIGSALKIIGVFALVIIAGFWMYQYLNNYTSRTLSTAFTFIPRQTQKAIPAQDSKEEKFKESFEKEKVNIETTQKPIRTIPEETLETEFPHGGPPVGIPYLGAPENTKPPDVSKLTPPTIPEIPKLPKLTIPLADFQEPKAIATPSTQSNTQTQVDTTIPVDNETINQQGQDINPLLNLVPGNPIKVDDKAEVDLWQRKEISSENPKEESSKGTHLESTEPNERPSWLN